MIEFLAGLGSGLLGAFLLSLFEPVNRWVGQLGRRLARDSGVRLHIEQDPAVIWAGMPDWVSFALFLPADKPLGVPPTSPRAWREWVQGLGGWDLGLQTIRLTLIGASPVVVIVETPEFSVAEHEVPDGHKLLHRTGGADISPRAINVELDSFGATFPTISWTETGGASSTRPVSFSLGKNEAEQILINISSDRQRLFEWTARLPILVDGRRHYLEIDDAGQPFKFVGGAQTSGLDWTGTSWELAD